MSNAEAPSGQLRLQRRQDLRLVRQHRDGRAVWVVKDPIALTYHQIGEHEHNVLMGLDGSASLHSLQQRFETAFAPRKISRHELQGLVGLLFRKGLLVACASGQGETLLARRESFERRRFWMSAANPLAIRFRGVDPERWLAAAYPYLRWIYSPLTGACCCVLIALAALLALTNYGELRLRLPEIESYFTVGNLFLLAICLTTVKVIHELAHALTCKHFGGECHEIGFMLLVFTPALYCDVSDAWLIESKWRRAAIAGAGIFVELVMASAALFLWWISQPGMLNSACLNIVVICSLSTVLINGNPLLRYDGYFLVSDLFEAPNLWQNSRDALGGWLRRLCLGVELPSDSAVLSKRPLLLIGYALASNAYRVFVVAAILLALNAMLKPHGFGVLAQALSALVVGVLLATPLTRFHGIATNPSIRNGIQVRRLTSCVISLLVLLLLALLVPLPYRVRAPLVLDPTKAQRVYAPADATIQWSVNDGDAIESGDVLVKLQDLDLEREVSRLQGERDQWAIRLASQLAMRLEDPDAGSKIPTTQETVRDLDARLLLQKQLLQRLTLRADHAGVMRAPPARQPEFDNRELPGWAGQVLDEANRGAAVERGELLGIVAQPNGFTAILYVEQGEMEFIAAGQDVRIDLDQLGLLHGKVESIAQQEIDEAPAQLHRQLAGEIRDGRFTPLETLYQVRVEIADAPDDLVIGASGRAKILTAGQSLGYRAWRAARRTFSRQLF